MKQEQRLKSSLNLKRIKKLISSLSFNQNGNGNEKNLTHIKEKNKNNKF
jgi:hypothetical protein